MVHAKARTEYRNRNGIVMFDWNASLSVGHGTEVLEGLHHLLYSVVSLLLFISGKTKYLPEGRLLWETVLP